MADLISPRTLKGFRDFLPEAMLPREKLIETARNVYRSFGFRPIDTPALEYLEVLTGKAGQSVGGDESLRQIYRFVDHGGRNVGMRFDLTVPLARFVAQHINRVGTPFKRYHIATVWRGESPQVGRYREFMQCDFDTIGTRSAASDIETGLVIHELMQALKIPRFTIHLNNRAVLNGLLESLNLIEKSVPILRTLDKLGKIGPGKVREEMVKAAEIESSQADRVLEMVTASGSNDQVLGQVETQVAGSETGLAGVQRLREILSGLDAAGVDSERLHLDVSIARGLDYYTGAIFETTLDDLPDIGSVCSGGRYDNLAQLYTKQELPGIGASLGLDRLLAALEKLGLLESARTTAQVLVVFFDADSLNQYLRIAGTLRTAGLAVELYPQAKKLKQQLKYAVDQGFRVAVIAGADELARDCCQVKDLAAREQQEVSLESGQMTSLIEKIRAILQ